MNISLKLLALSMVALSLPAISNIDKSTNAATAAVISDYGLSKENPIEVCKPQGQREYLSRLVCSTGAKPSFSRIGSVGERNPLPDDLTDEQLLKMMRADLAGEELKDGDTDYHIVDSYEVVCGEVKTVAFLDMYHCGKGAPKEPLAGFTISE